MSTPEKVLIGLSGGIASAVACALLRTQGHEVHAAYVDLTPSRFKGEDEASRFVRGACRCLAEGAMARTKEVAKKLDVPLQILNAGDPFEDRVVDAFLHERLQGRKPNPCFQCNADVRMEALFMAAEKLGCPRVATGHFVRVTRDLTAGRVRVHRAADAAMDQSYYLASLSPERVERLLMPLGTIPFSMVQKLAGEFEVPSLVESRIREGRCLIASPDAGVFIENRVAPSLRQSGMIKTVEGHTVGEHDGVFRLRLGEGLDQQAIAVQDPESYVVTALDPIEHMATIGAPESLKSQRFSAWNVHWIQPVHGLKALRCRAQVRPDHEGADCVVFHFENETVRVEFEEPQAAVLPGQPVAFYSGSELLGGGFIEKVFSDAAGK